MTDFLKCIKCKTIPRTPYECHQCGYLHCLSCLNSSNFCGTCKIASKFKVSRLASLLINQEPISCQFCDMSLSKGQLDLHLINNCQNAIFMCNQGVCDFVGTMIEIKEHIRNNHEQLLISLFSKKKSRDSFKSNARNNIGSTPDGNNSSKVETSSINTTKSQDKKDCCIF